MSMETREMCSYSTWYDFKKELQRRSGLLILNRLWLQVKPRVPLPWYEPQMKQAISQLSNKIIKLRVCPRCGSNLMLDRDVDGYYKRCILCSFSIEIITPTSKKPAGLFRDEAAMNTPVNVKT